MKKILIATTNKAKLEELKFGLNELERLGIKLVSLNDVRVEEEPEETGNTFKENSELKAKFYASLTRLPTIADDGGLLIPSLNNEPGVKSRRWLGYEATDEELINYALYNLRGCTGKKRLAFLETCITFFIPKNYFGKEILISQQEKIKGYIAQKPSGKATVGYPFRALFIVNKFNKYYDELSQKEHEKINHRLKALKKLIKKIKILISNLPN